jgi:interleukin enhancer-binding factor 2
VIKDIVQRFPGLHVLNRWTIDVLSHYSISFLRTDTTLPLNQALKRFFQLLAGGLFLPGSAGIPDPCENGSVTMHSSMTQKQQDRLCMTAQTIVRVLSHVNGFQPILGLTPDESIVLEKDFQFNGITIRSHDPVIGTIELENRQDVPAEVSAEAAASLTESMETTGIPVKEEHADDTSESITLFANDPQ